MAAAKDGSKPDKARAWLRVFAARFAAAGKTASSPAAARKDEAGLPAFTASHTLIDRLPDPLLVFDGQMRVLFANAAAQTLVGPAATGRHIATVLRNAPLMSAIDGVIEDGKTRTIEYAVPVPVRRTYSAFIASIGDGPPGPSGMVLVQLRDVTEARQIEAMRADFVAFASHELKTPLASLSGFIDTLRGHAKDDPAARDKFLGIMAAQADRMRRLIDDLLSLSRIELREHIRPSAGIDLVGVVKDVADGLMPLAEQQGVEIAVTAPAALPPVCGDREELTQVVQNLADNALRYGRSGKRIEISLSTGTRGGRPVIRLTVRDFGPGIDKDHIPRLTERFYRVDAAASRARGGTGLGLAIVKHIVNRHQGTLTIESEPGHGAAFTVLLPVAGDVPAEK